MASATPPVDANASEPEKKKTLFDIVLTATPVILTVVATFLIGQSTSEMTRAQYYRSVASQNQSKAGDQWALFQAKRIRGQSQEMAAAVLLAQSRTLFTRTTLFDACQGMADELEQTVQDYLNVKSKPDTEIAVNIKEKLIPKAIKLRDEAKALLDSPERIQPALEVLLGTKTKSKSKRNSTSSQEPKQQADRDESGASSDKQDKLLLDVVKAIKNKEPERKILDAAIKLEDATLEKAIADAERRANEVNKKGKTIDAAFEELDAIRDEFLDLFREYQQIVSTAYLRARPQQRENVGNLMRGLNNDYMAGKLAFGARRYEDDARSNQDSAYLYEVKVYSASAQADKHLNRSKMFLYAMLAAQAGVTISTLALAVRHKSVFWALAALTGLIAIGFGGYLLLDMPIPTF